MNLRARCLALLAASALAALLCGPARAQQPPPPPPARPDAVLELRNLMPAADFRAAGLERLSELELAALEDWVGRMVVRLLAARKRASCAAPVDSRVHGEFEGWDGGTVLRLDNGQVWRQHGGGERHAYRVSPRVFIRMAGTGCTMRVDGTEDEIPVERIW